MTAKQLSYDVMTNFVESRYTDWFTNLDYNRKDVEADELDIISLSFEEREGDGSPEPAVDENGTRTVFVITHKRVQDAMKKIASGETNVAESIAARIRESYRERDYLNLDAETDDCIIQIAAFGELVYG